MCRLCGEAGGYSQQHYLQCVVARAFCARHLATTVGEAATASAFQARGRGGHAAIRGATTLDAVDAHGHIAAHVARGAIVRPKEVVRRRAACRAALPSVRVVVPHFTEFRHVRRLVCRCHVAQSSGGGSLWPPEYMSLSVVRYMVKHWPSCPHWQKPTNLGRCAPVVGEELAEHWPNVANFHQPWPTHG